MTIKYFRVLSFCVAFSAAAAFAGPAKFTGATPGSMTLEEAIVYALAFDPDLRKKYADVYEAAGFSKEMRSDLLPQMRVEGSAGWAVRDRSIDGLSTAGGDNLFHRDAALIIEQLLWDNKYSLYKWNDAEQRLRAEELRQKGQREMTAFGVVNVYMNVLTSRRQVELARQNLAVHTQIRDLADTRSDGPGNQSEVELSEARYNLAATLLKERQLAVKQSEAQFKRYVGIHPPTLIQPAKKHIASRDCIDATQSWTYQAITKQLEAANYAKETVRSRYSPRVAFRGTGRVGEDVLGIPGEDNEASALVVVSWDLIESGRKKGQMMQAVADIERQTADLELTKVLLDQDIEARWADYVTARERLGIMERYSDRLEATVGLYEEQFELNERPLLSLLDIQNEEIGSRIDLTDQWRDFTVLGYHLLFFGGQLIPQTVGEAYLEDPSINPDPERLKITYPKAESTLNPKRVNIFEQDPYTTTHVAKPIPVAKSTAESYQTEKKGLFGWLKKTE